MKEKSNLYESLAGDIAHLIEAGALRPGERIPSVRKLSQERRVSVSTVLQAYLLLENQGHIEARPQSGYYVRLNPLQLPPQPKAATPCRRATTVNISDLVMSIQHVARDPKIVNLGTAFPSPELMPNAKFHRILAAEARRAGPKANAYEYIPGNLALRREISRRALLYGCRLDPDEIVTTVGGMEALNICLRAVTRPGDAVAVETPAYYGALQLMEWLGLTAVEVPAHAGDGMDLDYLEKALKAHRIKACVSIPNFHNPLGSLMPSENKKRLVEILAKREIPLIEDDVHGDLSYGSDRPEPAKSYDRKGLVLLCGSFSKTIIPGHRIGWCAPGRYQSEVEQVKFITTVATPTLTQLAIAEFLRNGGYDQHLRRLRAAFREQMQCVSQAVCKYFPKGTKISRPRGGFVLWVEMPPGVDSLELHEKALREGISLCPGPLFSAKQSYRNFIRLSCGNKWSDRIDHALFRMGQLAGQR